MLSFILGGAGTGKTAELEKLITSHTADGEEILLLVPDQMTFETERRLRQILPPASFAKASVFSFKRLCREIFRRCGGLAGKYADDVAKQTIMHLALCEIREELHIYRRYAASPQFAPRALDMVTELKNAAVTPQEFAKRIEGVSGEELKQKAEDIALIYQTYDAMLGRSFLDPLDDVSRAAALLRAHDCFAGQTVMLDGFTGFTAAQYDMLTALFAQAKDIFVTLCSAEEPAGEQGIFREAYQTRSHLRRIAAPYHPARIYKTLTEPVHFHDGALRHLSLHAMRVGAPRYEGEGDGVRLVLAPNAHEEVRYLLATVCGLVEEEGLRYRDIAVACRNPEAYLGEFRHMAERYGVPCFIDRSRSILHEPIVAFLTALLELVRKKQSANALLRMLRCGLLPYTVEEASEFENYLYIWNIRGEAVFSPFYANPAGFAEQLTEENAARLLCLEEMRQKLVAPAEKLRRLESGDGAAFCRALFGAICDYGLPDALEQLYRRRCEAGEQIDAAESARVYPQIIRLLDSLAVTLTDHSLTWDRFAELFLLGLTQMDLGERPQKMDAVSFSDVSRMRLAGPKVLFLLGVNEGELPAIPTGNSLLTESERDRLISLQISLGDNLEHRILAERFSVYCAVSAPSERLYLLAKKTDFSGESAQLSELYYAARRMFGENREIETERLSPVYFCRTEESTADTLASVYQRNTPEVAAVREALSKRPAWAGWLSGLQRAAEPEGFSFADPSVAAKLFGRRMRLSPSQVEQYYLCPFSYFCRHGLHVKPRKRAELNPLEAGTLIHDLLHSLVAREDFLTLTPAALRKLISDLLDDYIESYMGGADDKTARFTYLVRRMGKTVEQLVIHLQKEFRCSQFSPIAFELPVGGEDSPIGALQITDGAGGSAIVCGKIDRVDSFTLDGVTYMRVVDYKSGKKDFKLSDLYYGLNLQMLLYLFSIWKKGTGRYAGITPAGVLYLPSGYTAGELSRLAKEEEIEEARIKAHRMSGLLLQETAVLQAMEAGLQGVFLPVMKNDKGKLVGDESLYGMEQIGQLYRHSMKLLEDMYRSLQEGKVAPLPAAKQKKPCVYCEYHTVCGYREGDPARELAKLKKDELYSRLREEEQGNG